MKKIYILFLIPFSIYSQNQIGNTINSNAEHIETSLDGNKIAIMEDNNGTIKVKTYKYENSVWSASSINDISISDMGIDYSSLSMSKDGNFLAVGSSNRNFNSTDPELMGIGIVRVYQNINNDWVQVGEDLKTNNQLDGFGNSSRGNGIDLSYDGSIIAIGALDYSQNNEFGDDNGLVKVYKLNQGVWEQMGNDLIGNIDTHTGQAVALSDDGNILAVGSGKYQNFTGQINVYSFDNNNWVQIGSSINGNSEGDLLGSTLGISADGNRLAISAPNPENFTMGYAKVFENINNNWIQVGETISGNGTFDYFRFGLRLSFSSDGSILALTSNENTRVYGINESSINQINLNIISSSAPMNLSLDGKRLIVKNSSEVFVYDIPETILSVKDNEIQTASFFPNPASNQLNIILEENNSLKQLNIYTINGRKILSTNINTVNISSLNNGVYIVKIKTELGITKKKLLINR